MSIVIIGDTHGCYKTLMALIQQLPKDSKLCFTGDLIDRGPDSSKVVDFVRLNSHFCVRGNHEDMAIQAHGFSKYAHWLSQGGTATERSYDLEFDPDKFDKDREWFKTLPVILEFEDVKNKDGRSLLVSHSSADGFNDYYIMWNRNLTEGIINDIPGKFNIFGHSPVDFPVITDFFAGIDTACVYGGELTAISFPDMTVYTQKNIED